METPRQRGPETISAKSYEEDPPLIHELEQSVLRMKDLGLISPTGGAIQVQRTPMDKPRQDSELPGLAPSVYACVNPIGLRSKELYDPATNKGESTSPRAQNDTNNTILGTSRKHRARKNVNIPPAKLRHQGKERSSSQNNQETKRAPSYHPTEEAPPPPLLPPPPQPPRPPPPAPHHHHLLRGDSGATDGLEAAVLGSKRACPLLLHTHTVQTSASVWPHCCSTVSSVALVVQSRAAVSRLCAHRSDDTCLAG